MFGSRISRATVLTGLASLLTVCTGPVRAAQVAEEPHVESESWVVQGRALDITIKSPSISTELGSTKTVRLLLPPGWSKTASRTWPTLWLLHGGGAGSDHTNYYSSTDVNRLTANKQVIVVMPQTSWCSSYSDFWYGGKGGPPRWETFVVKEIYNILRNGYRAGDKRSVAGNSMGGMGAMLFAAHHPGAFQAAASFSGNLDPLHAKSNDPKNPDKPNCAVDWEKAWGLPDRDRDVWVTHDPVLQAAQLRGVKLYVSNGKNADVVENHGTPEATAMVNELNRLGIPHTAKFPAGAGHNFDNWKQRLAEALPMLLSAIGA